MLFHPKAPLIFASIMILALAGFLTAYHPSPGNLAKPHAGIAGLTRLSGCKQCHTGEGLARGCLTCHEEIAAQLDAGKGFHAHLLEGKRVRCASCHPDHHGQEFPLVSALSWKGQNPDRFDHPHLDFTLKGRHEDLPCGDCHGRRPEFHLPRFASTPRQTTYLGLSQECIRCHEDIHGGEFSGACNECHGQEAFRPAVFFHHDESFPLRGPHRNVECAGCHIRPSGESAGKKVPLTFEGVRGTLCRECHPSPHRAPWGDNCETCHSPEALSWAAGSSGVTAELHGLTGFRLVPPHEGVDCGKCHKKGLSFLQKYPSPDSGGYRRREENCEGCHEDIHGGQFTSRSTGCLDCHERLRFAPPRLGIREHSAFPLEGPHAAVVCHSCHKLDEASGIRRFTGTARLCRACHNDPHGGQFAQKILEEDCQACHDPAAESFRIQSFDHALLAGYELTGAHARARCEDCHRLEALSPAASTANTAVRRYKDTPTLCSSCHRDAHRGQFGQEGAVSCEGCHLSTSSWKEVQFDHNTQSRFPLDGTHEDLPCVACHIPVRLPGGGEMLQFKPLGMECKDCHGFSSY